MNGINNIEVNEVEFPDGSTITSAQSLVQLDTNNIFTAFNSFVEFPIKTGTTLTQLTPTADGQLTPKKYLDHKLGVIDTSLGIVDTSINSITQSIIKSVDFNTSSGILTLTKDDDSTLTKDLDGRYVSIGTSQTHTDETIFGVKTFNEFPTKTINADGTITEPTEDEELTTKKYVDDNTASLDGVNPFSGTNTFNTRRPTSSIIPTPPPGSITPPNHAQAEDFIIKRDGDELYRSITSNVFSGVLDINVSGNEQDLLRLNTFQTNGNTRSLAIRTPADVDVNDSAFIFQTDNAYKFMTDNTDALVIDAAGNAEFNGEIKSATIGGTTTYSGSELLVFRGAGNYPRLEIYGDNDGNTKSAELGRNGSSGHGYLRLKKSGVNNNGILLSGNGSSYIMGGNVGINDTNPSQKLSVNGMIHVNGASGINISRGDLYHNPTERYWRITNTTNYLRFEHFSTNSGTHSADGNMRIHPTSGVVHSSDDRIKENEKLIVNATETLSKLTPQIYDKYLNMNLSGKYQIESGLIAQEVYYNAPELRHLVLLGEEIDASGNEYTPTPEEMDLTDVDIANDPDYGNHGWSKTQESSLNYTGLIPYLIKSNQELAERLAALENK